MAAPGHRRRSRLLSNVVLIVFCLVTFIPVWYFLNNAFKEEKYVYQNPLTITPQQFTTDNVVRAFTHIKYARSFLNSFIFVTTSCTLLVFLASLAAYAIAVVGGKLLGVIYVGFVLMITLPFGLAMIPLVSLLRDLELLNTYLGTSLVYTPPPYRSRCSCTPATSAPFRATSRTPPASTAAACCAPSRRCTCRCSAR